MAQKGSFYITLLLIICPAAAAFADVEKIITEVHIWKPRQFRMPLSGSVSVPGKNKICTMNLVGQKNSLLSWSPADFFKFTEPPVRTRSGGKETVILTADRKCVRKSEVDVDVASIPRIVCKNMIITCIFPGTAPSDHSVLIGDEFDNQFVMTYKESNLQLSTPDRIEQAFSQVPLRPTNDTSEHQEWIQEMEEENRKRRESENAESLY